jgi:hypothetical protein
MNYLQFCLVKKREHQFSQIHDLLIGAFIEWQKSLEKSECQNSQCG